MDLRPDIKNLKHAIEMLEADERPAASWRVMGTIAELLERLDARVTALEKDSAGGAARPMR